MLNSTVTKILFDNNKRAVGVEFVHDNKLQRVAVAKEIVVSGGAVFSLYFHTNIMICVHSYVQGVPKPTLYIWLFPFVFYAKTYRFGDIQYKMYTQRCTRLWGTLYVRL